MRRMAEILAFLGLSAAVHAGVMAGFGDNTGGPQAQGQAGADRITLAVTRPPVAAFMPKSRYSKNERSPFSNCASLAWVTTKPCVVIGNS